MPFVRNTAKVSLRFVSKQLNKIVKKYIVFHKSLNEMHPVNLTNASNTATYWKRRLAARTCRNARARNNRLPSTILPTT